MIHIHLNMKLVIESILFDEIQKHKFDVSEK